MKVKSFMCKKLVTIEMDEPLEQIKYIFDSARFHHLLVTEAGKLFGIISDRDLLKNLSPYVGTNAETARDTATLNKKAHQIMTRKPITLPADAEIDDAIEIFKHHNISCIPVIDNEQKPIGIISWRDILKVLEAV